MTHATLYSNETLLDSIAVYAPSLTHLYLRISNIHDASIITRLEQVLNPPLSGKDPDRFPSALQRLFLHPGRKEPLGPCGTGYGMITSAKRRVIEYSNRQPKMVLLKEQPFKYENHRLAQDQEEGEDEFFHRVHGGLGCWDDANRMTSLI